MNKPNVTIALVRQILKFGRFETDLAALDKGNERYGRRGYTDARVGGKRIKLTALLSAPAMQYLQDALNQMFACKATVKQFTWVLHPMRPAREVTVIHIKQ
jgi:hypothetical protein